MKLIAVAAAVACCLGMSVASAQDTKVLPKRVAYVAPVYPEAARAAKVQGIVILEVLIDGGGLVTDAHVLKSIPELDMAAIDAVKQWKYQPTTLNGKPVQTWATVSVNFSLADQGAPTPAAASAPQSPVQWPPAMGGQQPVRVGGNVAPPERIKYVAPKYPQEAQDAGLSGIVIMEIVVDGEGKVAGSHVLRSVPMLDQAAMDAVMGWEYAPVVLNGAPVPVIMTVTVNFTLK